MPIVGSFAGASSRAYGLQAGVLIGDFESIATATATGSTTNVEFTSIPQNYKHLQIRGIGKNSASGGYDTYLQLNGVTSANYSYHYVYGTGGSVTAGVDITQGFIVGMRLTTPAQNASAFGVGIIDILDYADTNKFKTVRTISGFSNNDANDFVWITSGNFRSTNAITSIKLLASSSGNLAQYSTFALYGIKG